MDAEEKNLQLDKMGQIQEMIFWLRRIAYHVSPKALDFKEYVEKELGHARNEQGATEVFCDVRARSTAREREVSQDEPRENARVRSHPAGWASQSSPTEQAKVEDDAKWLNQTKTPRLDKAGDSPTSKNKPAKAVRQIPQP